LSGGCGAVESTRLAGAGAGAGASTGAGADFAWERSTSKPLKNSSNNTSSGSISNLAASASASAVASGAQLQHNRSWNSGREEGKSHGAEFDNIDGSGIGNGNGNGNHSINAGGEARGSGESSAGTDTTAPRRSSSVGDDMYASEFVDSNGNSGASGSGSNASPAKARDIQLQITPGKGNMALIMGASGGASTTAGMFSDSPRNVSSVSASAPSSSAASHFWCPAPVTAMRAAGSAAKSPYQSPYRSPYGGTVASLTSHLAGKYKPYSPYASATATAFSSASRVSGGKRGSCTPSGSGTGSGSGGDPGNTLLQHTQLHEQHCRQSLFCVRIEGPAYGVLHQLVELKVHITNMSSKSFGALQFRSSYFVHDPSSTTVASDATAGAALVSSSSSSAGIASKNKRDWGVSSTSTGTSVNVSGLGARGVFENAHIHQYYSGSILMGNTVCATGAAAPACLLMECRTQLQEILLPGATTTLTLHALPLQLGHLVLGALHLHDPQALPAQTYTLLQSYRLLILEREVAGASASVGGAAA